MDYKNGKIYRLVCNISGKQYIGSTTQPLPKRLYWHKTDFKKWEKDNTRDYTRSFDVLKNKDYDIILIENFPCNSKYELERRERYWIENTNCVNLTIPTRTPKEYKEDNRDKIDKYMEQWRHENKEHMKNYSKKYRQERYEYRHEKFECECGGKYIRTLKSQHLKTKKHQRWLESQTNKQEP